MSHCRNTFSDKTNVDPMEVSTRKFTPEVHVMYKAGVGEVVNN